MAQDKKKPFKFEFDLGFRQFFGSLFVIGLFFVMPVLVINNWSSIKQTINIAFDNTQQTNPSAMVAGLNTDNSGRYFQVPIINFQFDRTMREPATLSFSFGLIILVLAIIILLILFADFRKKEKKYIS